jgi:hypothetical protein
VITTGKVPGEAGWILLAVGIIASVLEPASGGWAYVAVGLLAVAASRSGGSAAGSGQEAGRQQRSAPAGLPTREVRA